MMIPERRMLSKRILFALSAAALPAICLAICGCGDGKTDADSAGGAGTGEKTAVRVVATTGMVADLALRVGGDRVAVTGLMGPGVDPHLYKASEGDVRRLQRADLVLFNGLHLEARMGEVLARLGERKPSRAVSAGIPEDLLMEPAGGGGAHDPHLWFDVSLWARAIDVVRDALAGVDPAGAGIYAANAERYRVELAELHAYILRRAGSVPPAGRVLVTAHDAFGYFGRAYGFEVRGLQGISTATEAGTADVADLAAEIAERRIPAVFIESSVPRRSIEAVRAAVRARGFEISLGGELYSDALGDPDGPAGDYIGMVRHNIDTIVAALAPEGAAREER